MATSLPEIVKTLEGFLPELKSSRSLSGFANDLYEATSYWANLGRWILERNTAVNFPARASDETELLDTLLNLSKSRPQREQDHYAPLFKAAQELLATASAIVPPAEGHLGFLKTVGELFRFVEDSGLRVVEREPTLLRYSSGAVYLNLECSKNTSIACSFGPESEPRQSFWIDDLLFMYRDPRYRTIPQTVNLNTAKDVEDWFSFVAGLLKRYGQSIFSNEPGIFQRLETAQAERDAEYTAEMDRKYGQAGPQQ